MILRHFRHHSQQCHCNICAIRYNCRPKGTLFRPFDTMTHYSPMVKLEIDVGLMIDLKKVCVWNKWRNPSTKRLQTNFVKGEGWLEIFYILKICVEGQLYFVYGFDLLNILNGNISKRTRTNCWVWLRMNIFIEENKTQIKRGSNETTICTLEHQKTKPILSTVVI